MAKTSFLEIGPEVEDLRAAVNDRLQRLADRIEQASPAKGKGPYTMAIAKLTGGGSNGTLTWNEDGVITKWSPPT